MLAMRVGLRQAYAQAALDARLQSQRAAEATARARALRRWVLNVRLAPDVECASLARRLVLDRFAGESSRTLRDLQAVISALVDNAAAHAHGPIRLRVARRLDRFRIDVISEGHQSAVMARPGERWHGPEIVELLSMRWGALGVSPHVWAEVAVADADG